MKEATKEYLCHTDAFSTLKCHRH